MVSLGTVETAVTSTIKGFFKMDEVTHMASVELWVLLTTLLLVVRFLLDFCGPWYANRSMTRIVLAIETLNYSLVNYTIGQMQLSAVRVNDYFQVWAVLLVTLQYSVKIGRPYSRSKQIPLLDLMSSFWTANLLRVQTFFLLKIPLWLIWALNSARIISYFFSTDKAEGINQESTRLIADYMSYEHELSSSQLYTDADINMKLYKYVILGEDQMLKDVQEGLVVYGAQGQQGHPGRRRRVIRFDPKDNKNLMTLDKIWDLGADDGRLLGDMGGQINQQNEETQTSTGCLSFLRNFSKNGFLAFSNCRPDQLKDVCLSFALYKLLRRRFYELPVHEIRLSVPRKKIRSLVFKYILGNAERAFRVAAMELYFLQDLFYSKHASMFANGFPTTSMVLSLLLVAAVGYIAYPIRYIPERMDQADHNRITHGVFITRVMIFLITSKELAEICIYVFSQWTKVLILCRYVKNQSMRHPLVEMAMQMVLCFMIRGRWDEKIRQHNLLISTRGVIIPMIFLVHFPSKFPKNIKLEVCTKKAIFNSLKKLETKNPASLDSYFLNAFEDPSHQEQLKWALGFEADTHKILVWHIATSLCEIRLASDATKIRPSKLQPRPFIKPTGAKPNHRSPTTTRHSTEDEAANWWVHYITAASLSNYCMYLVTQALVPDNGLVAKNVFLEVRREINHVTLDGSIGSLLRWRSMQDMYDRLMKLVDMPDEHEQTPALRKPDEEEPMATQARKQRRKRSKDHLQISKSLTRQGARLAKELMDIFEEDGKAHLWKQLAEFWTGFLLYLAASTRASKHRARLAGNRELTTHLWALLSHAGFLGSTAHGHTFLDKEELEDLNPLS